MYLILRSEKTRCLEVFRLQGEIAPHELSGLCWWLLRAHWLWSRFLSLFMVMYLGIQLPSALLNQGDGAGCVGVSVNSHLSEWGLLRVKASFCLSGGPTEAFIALLTVISYRGGLYVLRRWS